MRMFFMFVIMVVGSICGLQAQVGPTTRGLVLETDGADKEHRVALVIGNNNYKAQRLEKPVNDALSMKEALERLGFDVDVLLNADAASMERAVLDFTGKLRKGSVAVFYYAGHGVEIDGKNYLVAVDFEGDQVALKYKSIQAGEVLERMNRAEARLNLLILDACRDNPFPKTRENSRSVGTGLAPMSGMSGSYIAFAAGPKEKAYEDPAAKNGYFTGALAATLADLKACVTIDQVFNKVRSTVSENTKERQTPWSHSSIKGDWSPMPCEEKCTPLPQSQTDDARAADQLVERGAKLLASGEPGKAVEELSKAVEKNPGSAFAYLYRGLAYGMLPDKQELELKDLNRAVCQQPDGLTARLNRAMAYYRIESWRKAIADLNEVAQLAPQNADVFRIRGDAFAALGKNDVAEGDLRKALSLRNDDLEARQALGRVLLRAGRFDAAAIELQKVIDKVDSPRALLDRAEAEEGKGNRAEAEKLRVKARSLLPGDK